MNKSSLSPIDELPVTALPDRYGVARSQIYNRINALGLVTIKRDNRAYVSAEQIAQLDQIHPLIQRGKGLEDAAALVRQDSPVRQSRETAGQDSLVRPSSDLGQGELLQWLGWLQSQALSPTPTLLQRFEQLQAMADHDWRPSTSELAGLLGLKSLSRSQFERYGFRFTKAGKNGAQSAWRVEKV